MVGFSRSSLSVTEMKEIIGREGREAKNLLTYQISNCVDESNSSRDCK